MKTCACFNITGKVFRQPIKYVYILELYIMKNIGILFLSFGILVHSDECQSLWWKRRGMLWNWERRLFIYISEILDEFASPFFYRRHNLALTTTECLSHKIAVESIDTWDVKITGVSAWRQSICVPIFCCSCVKSAIDWNFQVNFMLCIILMSHA